jgi:hypothetical protein
MVCTCLTAAEEAALVTIHATSSEIHAMQKNSYESRTWPGRNGCTWWIVKNTDTQT